MINKVFLPAVQIILPLNCMTNIPPKFWCVELWNFSSFLVYSNPQLHNQAALLQEKLTQGGKNASSLIGNCKVSLCDEQGRATETNLSLRTSVTPVQSKLFIQHLWLYCDLVNQTLDIKKRKLEFTWDIQEKGVVSFLRWVKLRGLLTLRIPGSHCYTIKK